MKTTSKQILETTLKRVAPLPSQQGYARQLARLFAQHIHRNQLMDEGLSPEELPAPSAIVVAESGQGKTFLISQMAKALDLNLITVDGSSLVAEGYKGNSLSQRLEASMRGAKSKEQFAHSVLFVDEVDKLCTTYEERGNGMTSLLQLYNNGSIAVETANRETQYIDVSRFLILLGGAFGGLEEIVRNRLYPKSKIGFSAMPAVEVPSGSALLEQATMEDLERYGVARELLGRIGAILNIPKLRLEDYRSILTAETGSLQAQYRNYCRGIYDADVELAEGAVEIIAARCMASRAGARAAAPLVHKAMEAALDALDGDETIRKVIVDGQDGSCTLRYQRGPKPEVKIKTGEPEELPVHIVKSNTEAATVRSLLRYYRNAGGKAEYLPELEAYLGCVVPFLKRHCKPGEFTMENLVKLARSVQKNNKTGKSPFGIIMDDYGFGRQGAFRELERFYTDWTARNLENALETIWDYLREKHGPCNVRFTIPNKGKEKS